MKTLDYPHKGYRIHIPDPHHNRYVSTARKLRRGFEQEARRSYRRGFLTGAVTALAVLALAVRRLPQ